MLLTYQNVQGPQRGNAPLGPYTLSPQILGQKVQCELLRKKTRKEKYIFIGEA